MNWPVRFDPDLQCFIWSDQYAPKLLVDNFITRKELGEFLSGYTPTFPAFRTPLPRPPLPNKRLVQLWYISIALILPIIWSILGIRLLTLLRANYVGSTGLQLTMIFLLILAFSFVGLIPYALFRRYQLKIDVADQLDLLYHAMQNGSTNLEDLIEERDDGLYWKNYSLQWDLSSLFPTLSIVDLFAIFVAIFNQVYIFSWLVSLLAIALFPLSAIQESLFLLLVDLVIVLTVVTYVYQGIRFATKQRYYLRLSSSSFYNFVRFQFLSLILATAALNFLTFIFDSFSPIILIPFFLLQTPIFTAFIGTKLLYLRSYLRIRSALGRQLQFLRIQSSSDTEITSEIQYIKDASDRLDKQPILPTSRLRSYLLFFTALFSLLLPILTAFLSSIERFDEILDLLFP